MKKEVTIYDIAKALNIAASTVSRALSDHPSIKKETKDKIIAQAKMMNYRVNPFASNLRLKRSNTIGVVVPRLDSYFMSSAISGIETVLNEEGYNLIISQSQESFSKEKMNIATMYSSRVGGLIISVSDETKTIDHLNIFREKKIPVVFFDRVFCHPDYTCVIIDNFKAGYEATTHLINQGCRNIIHFTGNLETSVYRDRHAGYRKALVENNIPYKENNVFAKKVDMKNLEIVLEKIKAREILPDGIFAANDLMAVTLMSRLRKMGYSVPGDIAIVGFNNNPISVVIDPNLSTIKYPGELIGEVAAKTLIDQIRNTRDYIKKSVVLDHELIIRESSLRKKLNNV